MSSLIRNMPQTYPKKRRAKGGHQAKSMDFPKGTA
jgi:hypothetical protein